MDRLNVTPTTTTTTTNNNNNNKSKNTITFMISFIIINSVIVPLVAPITI